MSPIPLLNFHRVLVSWNSCKQVLSISDLKVKLFVFYLYQDLNKLSSQEISANPLALCSI
jgi:hypothetical protein